MPDKKLSDAEIKKALECCACEMLMYCEDQCPFYEKCMKDEQLSKYALDLINRLQAENERLQNILDEKVIEFAWNKKQEIKAEAYKEFADKFKEYLGTHYDLSGDKKTYMIVDIEDIDNLLKELVGENNSEQVDK